MSDLAEQAYRKYRAELEEELQLEIETWRELNESDPPRVWVISDSMRGRTDTLDEHSVSASLWRLVFTHLDNEIRNFAAVLLNRGAVGDEAVRELRDHARELIESLKTYKWKPELSRLGIDPSQYWPDEDVFVAMTSGYELMFWKLVTDPHASDEFLSPNVLGASFWWEQARIDRELIREVNGQIATANPTEKSPATAKAPPLPVSRGRKKRSKKLDGPKFAELRHRANMSQEELGAESHVTERTIQNVEASMSVDSNTITDLFNVIRSRLPKESISEEDYTLKGES